MPSHWRSSPQDLDPLSWFTGPLVAVVLGALSVLFGVVAVILVPGTVSPDWQEWTAVGLLALSAGLITRFSRPGSPRLGGLRAASPVLLACAAVTLAGFGYAGRDLPLDLWWAPVSLALILAALAPYSSPLRIVVVGTLSIIVTVAVIMMAFPGGGSPWPPFTRVLVGVSSVALSTLAGATFAYQVVRRVTRWTSLRAGPSLSSGVLGEAARLRVLRQELESVSARSLPLLRRIAKTGEITATDRQLGDDLARELRAELVERANRSWLDAHAKGLNLSIIDPQCRAEVMTAQQRTALLGMLRASSEVSSDTGALQVIELRAESDGSTAVAISMDVRLPEGRRLKLLAPHYLELTTTVDNLVMDSRPTFCMRFRLPPAPRR